MTQTVAFDLTPFIADSGISYSGNWWNLRFPNGAAANVSQDPDAPLHYLVELEDSAGEASVVHGRSTEDVVELVRQLLAGAPADADATAPQPQPGDEHQADEPETVHCGPCGTDIPVECWKAHRDGYHGCP